MREIKFRAWLDYGNGGGEMLPNVQNHINGKFAFGHIVNGSVDNVSELMQHTGLKDKNGFDIYEGDIVECWDTCGFEGISQSLCGEVTFNGGCFCVVDRKGYHNKLALTCAENVEVIGNIHENPELVGV